MLHQLGRLGRFLNFYFPKRLSTFLLFVCVIAINGQSLADSIVQIDPMTELRGRHTATLMNDGTVLIVGGFGAQHAPPVPKATVEIFDPVIDSFSPVASMNLPRYRHAAIKLDDGRVLVVGGNIAQYTATATAEIYDPATGLFTLSGTMTVPRGEDPKLVMRADGKIVVFGGANTSGIATDVVELFDPNTGIFSQIGNLAIGRKRLNYCDLENDTILVLSGKYGPGHPNNSLTLQSAEILSATTGVSTLLTSVLAYPHQISESILLDDGRCIIAAYGGPSLPEIYDPQSQSFSSVGSDLIRHERASKLIDGRVFLSGPDFSIFDPSSNVNSILDDTPSLIDHVAVTLSDGRVLITGGRITEGIPGTSSAYLFEPTPPDLPPTANAGLDQAVRNLGQTVILNGSGSFDDNTATDDLIYAWEFDAIPTNSGAVLTGNNTLSPSFVADVAGVYQIKLTVIDELGQMSAPDSIMVSSENLTPTASAGQDQVVVVGENAILDGLDSTDPEDDALSFLWAFFSMPSTSTAAIFGDETANPYFIPDLAGIYVVALTVSDSLGNSPLDNVTISALDPDDYASGQIADASTIVVALPPSDVTTTGNQNALSNFLMQAADAINDEDFDEAIDKLQKILVRTDGCELRGAPDGNGPGRDWITNCSVQTEIYSLITTAISVLE